jgi:hypothetical protein
MESSALWWINFPFLIYFGRWWPRFLHRKQRDASFTFSVRSWTLVSLLSWTQWPLSQNTQNAFCRPFGFRVVVLADFGHWRQPSFWRGVVTGDITVNLPSDSRTFHYFIQGHGLYHVPSRKFFASREWSSVDKYPLERPEIFQAQEFYHNCQYSPLGLVGSGIGYCTQHR